MVSFVLTIRGATTRANQIQVKKVTRGENCPCWMSLLSERTGPTALPHLQVCCCTAAFRCCRRCNLHQWFWAVRCKVSGQNELYTTKGLADCRGNWAWGDYGPSITSINWIQMQVLHNIQKKKQWSVQFHLLDLSQGVNWGCLCAERKTPRPGAIWQILGSSASSKVNCEWLLMMSGRPSFGTWHHGLSWLCCYMILPQRPLRDF